MESEKTNLILFATFWNEKDWIVASLKQIESLNPKEVIICDGCFDPKKENRSTDGTREIIENWVKNQPEARMISAIRTNKLMGLWKIFSRNLKISNIIQRKLMFIYYLKTNVYRINQAATFNKMISMATNWRNGDWFMTYDADQFYSDATIEKIKEICNSNQTEAELLTATEKTFFKDFEEYTTGYESRNFNNMPHKILPHTHLVPTRDIIKEYFPKPKVYGKDPNTKKEPCGEYFHYKFRPSNDGRAEMGYQLGDRKAPEIKKYQTQKFNGKHPEIIDKLFSTRF